MTVQIFVMPRANVRDPQSETVLATLQNHFGLAKGAKLSIGKCIELQVNADGADAAGLRRQMEMYADKFLANPNIETYRVEIVR